MLIYRYVAKDKESAKTLSGTLEAQSQKEAEEVLHQKNLIIVSLKQGKVKTGKKASGKIALNDLVVFSRQLATLIDSGVTLVAALDILKEQTENKALADIISRIYQDVEAGKSFCDAVAGYPAAFSDFYISMIRAGEASGTLDEVLDRLALYLEKTAALRRKIKSSLVYPAVVVTMAFSITAFLLLKVVPTFKSIFESLGGILPW